MGAGALEGPETPLVAAMCARPGGMEIDEHVEAALLDAARRLSDAGWTVTEIDDVPLMREAADVQMQLWLGDGFANLVDAASPRRRYSRTRRGRCGQGHGRGAAWRCRQPRVGVAQPTVQRAWRRFFTEYPVLLLPVSGELPFQDGLDLQGQADSSAMASFNFP